MTSRETSDPRIPSVPIEMASETVIVPKVNGVPSAANMPRFTSSTSASIPALQGVTSLWVDAMPTNGASMSLSLRPNAFIIERCGARIAPSVVSQLRHFPTARFVARIELSLLCGSLLLVIIVMLCRVLLKSKTNLFHPILNLIRGYLRPVIIHAETLAYVLQFC